MSRIAKAAIWVTFSEIIFNLSGFIIHAVLGRVLGPEDYGRYGLVITLTTMVIILIGNGIPTAMAKYLSEYFETDAGMVFAIKRKAVLMQSLLIGFITVIFFFSSPIIATLLHDQSLTDLFRLSSLIIPAFAAASFSFSYYTGLHLFNLQATLKIIRSFSRIGLVIALAIFFGVKGSILGYILAPTCVFFAALAFDFFRVNKELSVLPHAEKRKDFPWQKLFTYAWKITAFFLAYELLISIDLYLVQALLRDDTLTGIYNAVLTAGRIPYYIFYAMTIFLLPMTSKSASSNNHTETQKIISQALRIILILLVPMVALLSVFSAPTLNLLYGKDYVSGALSMAILVFGVGFLTLFYVMSFALNGAEKTDPPLRIAIVTFILNAVLNYLFILKYGIIGSAVATSIASAFAAIWTLFCLHRHFKVTYSPLSLLKVFFTGLLIFSLAKFSPLPEKFFIPESIFLFAIYLLVLRGLREIKKEDLAILRKMFPGKKK